MGNREREREIAILTVKFIASFKPTRMNFYRKIDLESILIFCKRFVEAKDSSCNGYCGDVKIATVLLLGM